MVLAGSVLMAPGVFGLTLAHELWQLYAAMAVMIPGWAAMGGGAINTIVAQWSTAGAAGPASIFRS